MVNYHQSLAFDHQYLSCNDHCDRWLFQEIFFIIIFRSRSKQMFFKTGVTINFAIFRGKHLCWSLFLIKLQAVRAEVSTAAKAICSDFWILTVKTRFRPLLYGQFNDVETNRWLYSSSSPLKNSPSLGLVLKRRRPEKFPFYRNK